jgi:hypothetical protein
MTPIDLLSTTVVAASVSGIVAAVMSGVVSIFTSERRIAAENVIQERMKWREKIRDLALDVFKAIISDQADPNKLRELRAQLTLRLNPHDPADQQILELVRRGSANDADEFTERVALLLKHDWERAKFESSLRRRACEDEPDRACLKKYGKPHSYTKRRWWLWCGWCDLF